MSINLLRLLSYLMSVVFALSFCFWLSKGASLESYQVVSGGIGAAFLVAFSLMAIPRLIEVGSYAKSESRIHSNDGIWRLVLAIVLWVVFMDVVMYGGIWLTHPEKSILGALEINFSRDMDANKYLDIAKNWYYDSGETAKYKIVFLPLYPVLIRVLNLFGDYMLAALLVSNIFAVLSGITLFKLAVLDWGEKFAYRAVRYMYLFPSAFFFFTPMTESLFMFLSILFVYQVRKRNYLNMLLVGACVGMTRYQGVLLLLPAFMELMTTYLQSMKNGQFPVFSLERLKTVFRSDRSVLDRSMLGLVFLLGIPLGFSVYLYINHLFFGSPFHFLVVQKEIWSQGLDFIWNTSSYLPVYALLWLKDDVESFWAISVPNLVVLYLSFALILLSAKKMRISYVFYGFLYFAISYGATWLLSGPRYMLCLFPLAFSAAILAEKRWVDVALTMTYGALFAAYLYMFIIKLPIS